MKAALRINHINHTIEMNKAYAKKAQVFGEGEYNNFVEAKNQFPTYKIIIKEAPKKRDSLKGLTYEYMEKLSYSAFEHCRYRSHSRAHTRHLIRSHSFYHNTNRLYYRRSLSRLYGHYDFREKRRKANAGTG